jgi:hypothetical protein
MRQRRAELDSTEYMDETGKFFISVSGGEKRAKIV